MHEKGALNAQNILFYLAGRFRDGFGALLHTPRRLALAVTYVLAVALWLGDILAPAHGLLEKLAQPLEFLVGLCCAVALFLVAVTLSAIPRGTRRIAAAFREMGLVNAVGTPPLAVALTSDKGRETLEVLTLGIPMTEFQDKAEAIEAALNRRITAVKEGRDRQHVLLCLAPGNAKLPQRVELEEKPVEGSSILRLGQSLDGEVVVDLNVTPHMLVAGSTGSGKTTLVKTIIHQLLAMKRADGSAMTQLYIIDLKGGTDYPPAWRDQVYDFAADAGSALGDLDRIVYELDRRQKEFDRASVVYGQPCPSLEQYNRLIAPRGTPLPRIVVLVDELAELTDTTGMDKPHKERAAKIVAALSKIARLGRAFGINLILSTQRPDADIVPGQIKNNVSYRVCGKADATLSTIVLGSAAAHEQIPKASQGLFLNHDGVLFKGYLPPDI